MTNLSTLFTKPTIKSFYFIRSIISNRCCIVQISQVRYFCDEYGRPGRKKATGWKRMASKNNINPSVTPGLGKYYMPNSSAPSEVYLQVIQSGCQGYFKSLFLFTSSNRYLINCPENSGRLLTNSFNRIGQLDNVFITQSTWSNIGGLPGFGILKRMAARRVNGQIPRPLVNFHGPKDMDEIFRATRCVYDGEPPVNLVERSYTLGNFEDDCLIMQYVPLFGRLKTAAKKFLDEDLIDNDAKLSVEVDKQSDDAERQSADQKRDVSVGYIFTLKPKPGHLLIEKCRLAGVPKGPMLGELANGNDVTLADGRIVRSVDVMTQAEPVPSFAVVDVSDEYFLDSLLKCNEFDRFFDESDKSQNVKLDLLVHLTTETIFASPSYQNWMKKFGSRTRHLVLNSLAPLLPHNEGIVRLQAQLNYINSDLFPLLDSHKYDKPTADLNQPVTFAEPLLKYHLRPHRAFERGEQPLEVSSYVEKMRENEEFVSAFAKHVEDLKQSEKVDEIEKYPELVFTGTGSACPTKVRNVTGILLNVNENHSILFDCGEGTYSQLFEFYGAKEIDKILSNIKLIFISHLHQDHHMGLFTVMVKRKEAFEKLDLNFEPVYVIGAPGLFAIQTLYSDYVEDILPFARPIKIGGAKSDTKRESEKLLQEVRSRLNLKSISVFPVFHPKWARGITVRLSNGKKIVYSGDTRPCPDLIEIGQNADFLIHEATFENELIREAVKKNHSTVTEAIDVSEKMNARRTVLTHISARYPRMPIIDETNLNGKVGFAFDFLKVNFSNFETLTKLIPIWQAAFAEYDRVPQSQSEKREAKRFREDFQAWREKRENEKRAKLSENE